MFINKKSFKLIVVCPFKKKKTLKIHVNDSPPLYYKTNKKYPFNLLFLTILFGCLFQSCPPSQVVILDFIIFCSVLFDKVGGFLVVSLDQVFHFFVVLLLKFHKRLLLLQLFNCLRFYFCNKWV